MRPIFKYYILCAALVLLGLSQMPTYTLADEAETPPPVSPGRTLNDLDSRFLEVKNLLAMEKFGAAAERLKELKRVSLSYGFFNLPYFSEELLLKAEVAYRRGESSRAEYYLNWAEVLSPEDPGVLIKKSTYLSLISFKEAAGLLISGLSVLPRYPSVWVKLSLNLLLVLVVASTLALAIVVLVQLYTNRVGVFTRFSRPIPLQVRGLLGPPFLLLVLVVPLIGGLLSALLVWSLLASLYLKRCKWFAAMAGILVICWGLLPSPYFLTRQNLSSDLRYARESLNQGAYVPNLEQDFLAVYQKKIKLLEQLKKRKVKSSVLSDSVSEEIDTLLVAKFKTQLLEFDEAAKLLEAMLANLREGSLVDAARVNLSTVYIAQKRFDKALQVIKQLEDSGYKSFAMYFNAGVAHLSLLDPAKHRKYYQKAKELDTPLMKLIEQAPLERQLVFEKVPESAIFKTFFEYPVELSFDERFEFVSVDHQGVLGKLFLSSNSFVALLLGVVFVILGLIIRFQRDPQILLGEMELSSLSRFIPGVRLASGRMPLLGFTILTIILTCFFIGVSAPVNLMKPFQLPLDMAPFFLVVTAIFALLSVVLSSTQHGSLNLKFFGGKG